MAKISSILIHEVQERSRFYELLTPILQDDFGSEIPTEDELFDKLMAQGDNAYVPELLRPLIKEFLDNAITIRSIA